MVKILLPHEIAKTCFLMEALLYRAIGRLPLETISGDEVYAPDYADLVLSPEECRVGGLQPDPEWEEREKGEGERLLDATVLAPADSDERQTLYEQWIKWKAVKDWRRKEWIHALQELLGRHHDEFLKGLLEGRLRSQGQRSGLLTRDDVEDGASLRDIPREAIPSTFWSSCEIDWEKCQAHAGAAAYNSIVLDTGDLFSEFPLPTPQVATGVSKYGAYFVLSDELAGSTQKLGRPPEFNWDELQLELARRAVKGDLPIKQEAFYEDMRNWCQSQWGRVPGETSLKGKIRPYYYEFVRPKKVRK